MFVSLPAWALALVVFAAVGAATAGGYADGRRGRGLVALVPAAVLVGLLLVTFDLDRQTRGIIRVPSTPPAAVRASMALPPAAQGPTRP